MATYLVDCIDGSDQNCWGKFEVDIGIEGLSDGQLKEIVEDGTTCITEEQLKSSGEELGKDDAQVLKRDGCIDVAIHLDSCGACGSSETYDSDGNNITSL